MSGAESCSVTSITPIRVSYVKWENALWHTTAQNERNDQRLLIVYTTPEILQKLDYLAGIHGSKKAAISALYYTEERK